MLKESTCIQKRMEGEGLSSEMVDSGCEYGPLAVGMTVSEATTNPTMITVKGLGNIKIPVSLQASLLLFKLLHFLGLYLKCY